MKPKLSTGLDEEFRDMRKIHGTQSLFQRKGLYPEFSVSCPGNSFSTGAVSWGKRGLGFGALKIKINKHRQTGRPEGS
jgi:hypothetical protein